MFLFRRSKPVKKWEVGHWYETSYFKGAKKCIRTVLGHFSANVDDTIAIFEGWKHSCNGGLYKESHFREVRKPKGAK